MSLFPDPETVRVSGLGNKAVLSLVGDYFYFAPSMGLGYWDVCAGHALAREVGGGCYYVTGEEIVYPEVSTEKILPKVFCLTSSNKKAELFISKIKEANITI